jgi:hypothetical protein
VDAKDVCRAIQVEMDDRLSSGWQR